jgi:hypothetical protein
LPISRLDAPAINSMKKVMGMGVIVAKQGGARHVR